MIICRDVALKLAAFQEVTLPSIYEQSATWAMIVIKYTKITSKKHTSHDVWVLICNLLYWNLAITRGEA